MTQEEQIIIEKLGTNHTDPIVFNKKVCIVGLYTYRGGVCCLNEGMDFDFDTLTKKEQKEIVAEIEAKRYKVDPTCQG